MNSMRRLEYLALLCFFSVGATVVAQNSSKPHQLIIDMHLHALRLAGFGTGPGPVPRMCSNNENLAWEAWDTRKPFTIEGSGKICGNGFAPARTDEELMQRTLAQLKRYNIRAVTSGPIDQVAKWRATDPDRIIAATPFRLESEPEGQPVQELRRLVSENKVAVFAEVGPQYAGMSPADPALEPYWALAEELDIPVGLHMGEGPPGGRNVEGYSAYRVKMGNPLLLEDVLVRHPKLRIYVMHYGSPFVDDIIALLYSYPQVYVDIAGNDWSFPRKHFHAQLRRLVEAGFGKRILFGSDQMIWPDTIGLAIATIESAEFLTQEQKRDIFCRNAARFLRLDAKACD